MVKDRVTVPMLLERYGVKIARGGRCACPVHQGKDLNMTVRNKWYRCFRCGASGTVIDLLMALDGITFGEACARLDSMFGLGLAPTKPSEQIAAHMALARREQLKKQRTVRRSNNDHQYTLLCYLRRYCADSGIDTTGLDNILDYYLGYDDDDALPDAFRLAADAGLGREMEVMILAAYDTLNNADDRSGVC